jgi:hypothetical protein
LFLLRVFCLCFPLILPFQEPEKDFPLLLFCSRAKLK